MNIKTDFSRRAGAEQAPTDQPINLPPTDDEIENMAHSACEEALSFGLSVDSFTRPLKMLAKKFRAAQSEAQSPQGVQGVVRDTLMKARIAMQFALDGGVYAPSCRIAIEAVDAVLDTPSLTQQSPQGGEAAQAERVFSAEEMNEQWSAGFKAGYSTVVPPAATQTETTPIDAEADLTAAYMAGVERGKEIMRAQAGAPGRSEQAEPVADTTQYCWLVELFHRGDTGNSLGRYHTGFTDLNDQSRSTENVYEAKRYATKRGAEVAAFSLKRGMAALEWRAIEHGFMTLPSTPLLPDAPIVETFLHGVPEVGQAGESQAAKCRSWLHDLMGDHDFTLPANAFEELIEALAAPRPLLHGAPESARQPLTEEQLVALKMMLHHYGNDSRTKCLLPLIEQRAHGIDSATAMKAAGARE